MVQFVHDIIRNLDWAVNPGHKQTHLIIMDFAKAFDKVPRRAITQIGLLWDKRVHPQQGRRNRGGTGGGTVPPNNLHKYAPPPPKKKKKKKKIIIIFFFFLNLCVPPPPHSVIASYGPAQGNQLMALWVHLTSSIRWSSPRSSPSVIRCTPRISFRTDPVPYFIDDLPDNIRSSVRRRLGRV